MLSVLLALQLWTAIPDPTAIYHGSWRSCSHSDGEWDEQSLDYCPLGKCKWEFHLGPQNEFALFKGVSDDHRPHNGAENLLGKNYDGPVNSWRDARQWSIPSLGLWISVVKAGGVPDNCEGWLVKISLIKSRR